MELEGFDLNKVRSLFFKAGVKSITMDDVCKELGISKKTLYLKIENKSILVEKVFMDDYYCFRSETIKILCSQTDPITRLHNLYKYLHACGGKYSSVMLFSLKKYYTEFELTLAQLYKQHINLLLKHIIDEGLETGYLNKNYSKSFIGEYFEQNVFGFLKDVFFDVQQKKTEHEWDYFYLQSLGVCTDKGMRVLRQFVVLERSNIKI